MARRARVPLKFAARINSFDRPYWEQEIRPHVDGRQVEYVGEISDAKKSEFLGRARALLFPIRWPEPFGPVMIEAMACGTPVIGYPCGAVPEVIADGVTGRIVGSIDDAVSALAEVGQLDRATIRCRFEHGFRATGWPRPISTSTDGFSPAAKLRDRNASLAASLRARRVARCRLPASGWPCVPIRPIPRPGRTEAVQAETRRGCPDDRGRRSQQVRAGHAARLPCSEGWRSLRRLSRHRRDQCPRRHHGRGTFQGRIVLSRYPLPFPPVALDQRHRPDRTGP
ncbi:glycosyltransferase [Roseicyclus sp.]